MTVNEWLTLCCCREPPPSLPEESCSTSALISDDTTDLAFPHLKHRSAVPLWITNRKATSQSKHKIGASNSEILDEDGRPAWLNDKQREMFDQVKPTCNGTN